MGCTAQACQKVEGATRCWRVAPSQSNRKPQVSESTQQSNSLAACQSAKSKRGPCERPAQLSATKAVRLSRRPKLNLEASESVYSSRWSGR
jgi:hypothetical protein